MRATSLALALALSSLAALAGPAAADQVFLNSGAELSGTIVKIDAGSVRLRDDSGAETAYPRSEVLKVKLIKRYGVPGEEQPGRIADETVRGLLRRPPSPDQYPDDGVLHALDEWSCRLDARAGARCSDHAVDYVLRERGKDEAANSRYRFLSGIKSGRVEWARSISPSRVSDLDDTSVQEGSEYPDYPRYDKMRSVKFAVPDVATGSIVDYRFDVDQPVSYSTFPYCSRTFPRSNEPARLVRIVLDAPQGLALKSAAQGEPKPSARVERSGGRVRYVWEWRDLPSLKSESQMPPATRASPGLIVAAADTWQGVAGKLAPALAPLLESDPRVAELAASLVKGSSDPVEALYDWVAVNVKLENVRMSEFGYVPHPAGDTLKARAGNELDKPFLLFSLLRAAGFDPSLVYAEARTDDPFEPTVPTVRQFEVALVRLTRGGRDLFLAPIEDSRRYDELGGWLQGVHGLVVAGPGAGTIVETPVRGAEDESESETLKLSLSADGTLSGRSETTARGGPQSGWRELKDLSKDDLRRNFEERAHWLDPHARLKGYRVANLADLAKNVAVSYDFEAPGYALTASGGFLALRLPDARHPASDLGAPSRETPLFWWERSLERREASLALPPGYTLYSAPDKVTLSGPGSSYQASYAYDAASGTLRFREEIRRDAVELPPSDYAAYKAFRERLARFGEQWIVLRKSAEVVRKR